MAPKPLLDPGFLDCAIGAAEHCSFRRAADALGLQQSTVSRRIRHLEDEIGFALFERSHAGVLLTEAGNLRDVRAALRHLDQATVAAQSVASGEQGRLRLAASEDAMPITLARVLTAHRARWPKVSIDLVEMPPSEQLHALRSGLVDLGLMLQPADERRLSVDPLWAEACMVALPKAHPLARKSNLKANDSNGQHVVVGEQDGGFQYGRLVVGLLKSSGVTAHIAAEVVHIQTALMMVQTGIGIAFVPATFMSVPSAGAIFRHVRVMSDCLSIRAVWATDDPSGLVAQFLRTARATAAPDQAGI